MIAGIVAGAAGTTALNAVTYLDMVVRARPASSSPQDVVHKVEQLIPLSLSSDGPDSRAADNRRSGLGSLLGIATGLGTGAIYGLLRPRLRRHSSLPVLAVAAGAAAAANVGSVAPMAALGVSDPSELVHGLVGLRPGAASGLRRCHRCGLRSPLVPSQPQPQPPPTALARKVTSGRPQMSGHRSVLLR